jgi:hypothetical protein
MTSAAMTERAATAPHDELYASLIACHGKLNTLQTQLAALQSSVTQLTETLAVRQIAATCSQPQRDASTATPPGAAS